MQELQIIANTVRLWIVFAMFRFSYIHISKRTEKGKKTTQNLIKDLENSLKIKD